MKLLKRLMTVSYHFANEDGNRSQNNRWNRGHRSIRTF